MRSVFLKNLPLKLIALVLAFVLFLIVRADMGATTQVEVPLIVRVPSGYVQVSDPVESIGVRLAGRWSKLQELHLDELGTLSISPAATPGRTRFTFRDESLAIPPGLVVESFDPPSITITLEEEASRTVPVAADRALRGNPPPGYQLGEVNFEPSQVTIVGPRSVVETVSRVYVEPINVDGKTRTFTEDRYVLPDRRSVRVSGSGRVTVRIEIVAQEGQRVVLGVPILPLNLTRPHELRPRTVDLVLVGEEEALATIVPAELMVRFDAIEYETSPPQSVQVTNLARLVENLPDGVAVESARPPTGFLTVLPANEPLPAESPEPSAGETKESPAPDAQEP